MGGQSQKVSWTDRLGKEDGKQVHACTASSEGNRDGGSGTTVQSECCVYDGTSDNGVIDTSRLVEVQKAQSSRALHEGNTDRIVGPHGPAMKTGILEGHPCVSTWTLTKTNSDNAVHHTPSALTTALCISR